MNSFRQIKFRAWLAIFISSMLIPNWSASLQESPQPIARNKFISAFQSLGWHPNRQVLIFQNQVLRDSRWIQYNLIESELSETEQKPFLPNISDIQADEPEENLRQSPFVFPSPNGHYVVYGAPRSVGVWSDGRRRLIALRNIETQETTIINLPLDVWMAKWSSDSSAFVIETMITSGGTVVFYFNNFNESVLQVRHADLTRTVELNGDNYAATGLYAISNKGDRVLLRGYKDIAIWEFAESPNISSFADNIIFRAATFTPDDSGALYLTKTGMFRYDFATQQTTPVALQAGTELLQNTVEGSISPDGKHVAIIVRDNVADDYALYVLEVAQGQ